MWSVSAQSLDPALDRSAGVATCSHTSAAPLRRSHRPRKPWTAWPCSTTAPLDLVHTRPLARCRPSVLCHAEKQEPIRGFTPANYISYSDSSEHTCHHMIGITVEAPVSVCFDLWDDWCRLLDFLDLVSQIGLDPEEPDMGLFQCFYRWGRMPVMEIVFLARKTHVEQDALIEFDTVWGMPANGQVEFVSESETRTTVILRLQHQMPWLLVDLKVGVTGLETHMRQILQENLDEFKTLAEAVAADPANAPPRQGAGAPYVPRREQPPQPAGLPLGVEGEEGEEIYIRAKDTWEGPVLGEPKQEDMQMHPLDASVVGDLQPQQPAAAVTQPEPPSRPPPVPPPAAPAAAKARQATPTQRPAPQPAEAAAPASRARRGSRTAKSVTPTVKAVSGTSVNGLPPAATPKRPGRGASKTRQSASRAPSPAAS